MRDLLYLAIMAFLLFISSRSFAYPDLIRHHYVNCSSCHVSPTGGGALNAYGRSMTRELLSAWGGERETAFLHGVLPENTIPEWLSIGGDVRGIQVHREDPSQTSNKWFIMQASLELAAKVGELNLAVTVGQIDPARNTARVDVATKYYALWSPKDELALRVGKFTPVFGVNVPYHTLPTRQGLRFGPGQERNALEGIWSGEIWNFGLSLSQTPNDFAASQQETLVTAQVNRTFSDSYRFGASFLSGAGSDHKREAFGIHAIAGISERLAIVSEVSLQRQSPQTADPTTGVYHFGQLLFELSRGWNVYLLEEYSQENLSDGRMVSNSLGPGVRVFPRPHFELDAVFLKKRVVSVAGRYDDYAWLLAHYYF